jgi:hypothetical protein
MQSITYPGTACGKGTTRNLRGPTTPSNRSGARAPSAWQVQRRQTVPSHGFPTLPRGSLVYKRYILRHRGAGPRSSPHRERYHSLQRPPPSSAPHSRSRAPTNHPSASHGPETSAPFCKVLATDPRLLSTTTCARNHKSLSMIVRCGRRLESLQMSQQACGYARSVAHNRQLQSRTRVRPLCRPLIRDRHVRKQC